MCVSGGNIKLIPYIEPGGGWVKKGVKKIFRQGWQDIFWRKTIFFSLSKVREKQNVYEVFFPLFIIYFESFSKFLNFPKQINYTLILKKCIIYLL